MKATATMKRPKKRFLDLRWKGKSKRRRVKNLHVRGEKEDLPSDEEEVEGEAPHAPLPLQICH